MWAQALHRLLSKSIRTGHLTVTFPDGLTRSYGPVDGGPRSTLRIEDAALIPRLFLSPQMALGEGFMAGGLTFPTEWDIRNFLRIAVLNRKAGALPLPMRLAQRLHVRTKRFAQWNTLAASLRRVRHHYEIPEEFYALFLDRDLQYTCAYYQDDTASIDAAQIAKMHLIARKLCLSPGMQVLDIGCGWGGLAVFLAREYGVRVTGITLSQSQLDAAEARARAAGVEDRVGFLLRDYRHVEDRFDRVVSVGMMEHVGAPQYQVYFNRLAHILNPDGIALIHFIGRSTPPAALSPWFDRYIFPGGYAPAFSEVVPKIENSGLILTDLEVWRGHYEKTLRAWQDKFRAAEAQVRAMFDDRFIRMWWWYLLAAEVSFTDMNHVVFQCQLGHKPLVVPERRDYLFEPVEERGAP